MTSNEDASSEHGDLLLGKLIAGNFRVQRLIGCGAMGNVYQAEQLSLGKPVAIKALHPHLMSDDKLVRRFQREAKSASRLNHPNSIQIIDSGQDATGTLYIAMELLTGRDLAQVIRDEFPLPIPRIVRIMSQVLSALDEAHAQGVIHRDLKPSNIMLIERRGEPDFVKVCDYGIAKAQLEEDSGDGQMLTIQGLVCGTPEYMSPEQARGEPLDGRADLYSAAVILYHMVTGDIPFRAATPIAIVSRHLSEAPAIPSSRRSDPAIPPDLDDLILRGLAKSRELRPASAAVFREELESIGSGRAGRRFRANSNTLPATEAVDDRRTEAADDARPTTQFPVAAAPLSRRRSNVAKVLAIGLVLAAGLASAALILLRRTRLSAPTQTPVSELHSPLPEPRADPRPTISVLLPEARRVPEPDKELALPAVASTPETPPAPTPPKSRPGATGMHDHGANRDHEGGHPATVPRLAPTVTAGAVPHPPSGPAAAPPSSSAQTGSSSSPAVSGAATPAAATDGKLPGTPRGPREMVADGEKLLAQGEVAEACRRGEEAKTSAPNAAPPYKFLGKCYMRAGKAGLAKENYRRYLDLAPNAPDKLFIESIVK